jgi:hypothetical protein
MDQGNNIARSCVLALVALALAIVPACGGGAPSGGGASSGGGAASGGSGQPFATVMLAPPSVSMARGNQRSSTLTTQFGGGFAGSLTLTATGAPQGVTVSFDPQSVPGSGSSNVTVSVAAGTPTGSYPITISGSGSGLVKTTTLTVIVTAEVLLTWNPSTSADVVGYNVARSDSPGSGYVQLNSALISGTSYVDDTAQSGHTYYYVAMAVDSAGLESAASNEAPAEVP